MNGGHGRTPSDAIDICSMVFDAKRITIDIHCVLFDGTRAPWIFIALWMAH